MIAFLIWMNQPSCESCHKDSAKEWAKSVHEAKGIGCTSCHGTDGYDLGKPSNPHLKLPNFVGKPAQVVPFCGKCHAGVAAEFGAGKHGKLPKGQELDCLSCHDNHKTRQADFSKLVGRCQNCHKEGDPVRPQVAAIGAALSEVRSAVRSMAERLRGSEDLRTVPGIDLGPDDERARAASLVLSGLRTIQHGVPMGRVREARRRASELADGEERSLSALRQDVAKRPLYLGVFLLLFVAGGVLASKEVIRITGRPR